MLPRTGAKKERAQQKKSLPKKTYMVLQPTVNGGTSERKKKMNDNERGAIKRRWKGRENRQDRENKTTTGTARRLRIQRKMDGYKKR